MDRCERRRIWLGYARVPTDDERIAVNILVSAGDTWDAADMPLGSRGPALLVILRASIDDVLAGLLNSGMRSLSSA